MTGRRCGCGPGIRGRRPHALLLRSRHLGEGDVDEGEDGDAHGCGAAQLAQAEVRVVHDGVIAGQRGFRSDGDLPAAQGPLLAMAIMTPHPLKLHDLHQRRPEHRLGHPSATAAPGHDSPLRMAPGSRRGDRDTGDEQVSRSLQGSTCVAWALPRPSGRSQREQGKASEPATSTS